MPTRAFTQVDVFTHQPYWGNPLGVVLDGTGMSADDMQHFARWTNLSETAFLLPPTQAGAHYKVRIFTPGGELPFAGHPTLGSCHAWLQAHPQHHDLDTVVQECGAGLITIRRLDGRWAFAAPTLRRRDVEATMLNAIASALGIQASDVRAAQWLDNGPTWLGLVLDSPGAVLKLAPNHTMLKALGHKVGVVGIAAGDPGSTGSTSLIHRNSREAQAFAQGTSADQVTEASSASVPWVEVRAFAAPIGITEDPVTGSLNASLAQWLIADGTLPKRYVATQGTCLTRHGQVHVQQADDGQVWIGGDVVSCIQGTVAL